MKFKTNLIKNLTMVSTVASLMVLAIGVATKDNVNIVVGIVGLASNFIMNKQISKIKTEYCEMGMFSMKIKEVK